MPLPPYEYHRPTTPSATEPPELIQGNGISHTRNASGSSFWSTHSSPDSIDFHVETPAETSPIRQRGPTLLPRIRTQDSSPFDSAPTSAKTHRRALSNAFNPPAQPPRPRPTIFRNSTSPPECMPLRSPLTPASASSVASGFGFSLESAIHSHLNSPISFTPALQRRFGHSRSISASSIDQVTLAKYGYPYRQQPAYIPGSYWSPSVTPGASTFVPPTAVSGALVQHGAWSDEKITDPNEAVSNLNTYLRGPNPAVDIVRVVSDGVGQVRKTHAWWDIRNLNSWDAFSLSNIMETQSFPELFQIDVGVSQLPTPQIPAPHLHPESEAALAHVIREFYVKKVNAALKTAQGLPRYMVLRPGKHSEGPDFIANYQDDDERTISGNGKGRVVGIVRSYERWNTGLRAEAPSKRIEYLEGLATLHQHMRDSQCRYGFIMTETELVCVRAGTDQIPFFGHLELAPTIETRQQDGLTACLALWYLHMLAKDEPLPGQCGWKIDVGAPVAMTRKHVMPGKDSWIPKPNAREERTVRIVRGWAQPHEAFHRKREGGGRK